MPGPLRAWERRPKGSGAIFRRHDHPSCPPLVDGVRAAHRCRGRWTARYELPPDANGHRRRKVIYGHTRAEVAAKLKAALEEHSTGGAMSTALRDMPIVATVLAGGQFDAAAVDEEFDGYTADERAGMARALEEIGGRLISLGDQLRRATR